MAEVVFRMMLRNRDGNANVPNAKWDGGRFDRNANWLDNDWDSNDRVVLLVNLLNFRSALYYSRGGFL